MGISQLGLEDLCVFRTDKNVNNCPLSGLLSALSDLYWVFLGWRRVASHFIFPYLCYQNPTVYLFMFNRS